MRLTAAEMSDLAGALVFSAPAGAAILISGGWSRSRR